ncbi:MAG: hypothetical protein CMJ34_05530 [Phycisphaerae bacterium]|nr:hypothetical protein [Phycisphaerae bacterium]
MESFAHLELKRLAVAWLARLGCQAIATEVRCPISKYRIDVAGWLDHADGELLDAGGLEAERPGIAASLFTNRSRGPRSKGPRRPRTIVVECKRSRPDFIRDDRDADRLKARLESLRRTRTKFERDLIPRSEPHLRESGSSLFPDLETWDFEGSRTSAYRRLLRTIERIERRLHGETKFHTMPRYRLADHFYLFTPTGLLKPRELPDGWGLVECGHRSLRDGAGTLGELDALPLRERVACPSIDSPMERRHRMLRNIAAAAGRSVIADAVRSAPTPESPRSPARGDRPREPRIHGAEPAETPRTTRPGPGRPDGGTTSSNPASRHHR